MSNFSVNTEICTKCYSCVKSCPVNDIILVDKDTGFPYADPVAEKLCVKCGHCIIHCPTSAASLAFYPRSRIEIIDIQKMPTIKQAEVLLKSRRSVRQFKNRVVDHDTIMRILDIAKYAPSGSNMQPVRWIIVENPDITRRLSKIYIEWLALLIKDNKADEMTLRHMRLIKNGIDPIFRGAKQLAITLIPKDFEWYGDAVIAITYFELAAHSMSLGTCWGGFIINAIHSYPPMREALGIKAEEQVGGLLLFGYPALTTPSVLPPRRPADAVIM